MYASRHNFKISQKQYLYTLIQKTWLSGHQESQTIALYSYMQLRQTFASLSDSAVYFFNKVVNKDSITTLLLCHQPLGRTDSETKTSEENCSKQKTVCDKFQTERFRWFGKTMEANRLHPKCYNATSKAKGIRG